MDHRLHVRLSILLIFLFSSLAVHATDVSTIYTVNFTGGLDRFTIQDDILLNGNSAWQRDNKYGMKASGYSDGNHQTSSWLKSPTISLKGYQQAEMVFSHAIGYITSENAPSYFTMAVSIDNCSSWTPIEISFPNKNSASGFSSFQTDTVDLSAYAGQDIVVGYHYTSDTSCAGTWEIKTFEVKGEKVTYKPYDINGDGTVNISDVTTLVDFVLGKNPSPCVEAACDVNGDGSVNISDVTYLVDVILGKIPSGGETPETVNVNRNRYAHNGIKATRLEFPHLSSDSTMNILVEKSTTDFGVTFSLEWDCSKKANRWTAYQMHAGNTGGNVERQNDFREDPDIPSQYRSTLADYKGSKFDRGHLCPSADRLRSVDQNSQTFFLSNMQPQYSNHNSGKWAILEGKVRTWAGSCDTLYVVKAATITDVTLNGSTQSGLLNVMCNNSLIVPAYFYMAMMSYNKSTDTYNSLGIWTNHSNTASEITIEYITIDELEQRTGIDFFCNLPDEMEDEVESSLDLDFWGITTSQ